MITFFGGKLERNKKVFRSGIFQRTKTNLDFTDTGISFRLLIWYIRTYVCKQLQQFFILLLLYGIQKQVGLDFQIAYQSYWTFRPPNSSLSIRQNFKQYMISCIVSHFFIESNKVSSKIQNGKRASINNVAMFRGIYSHPFVEKST